jgi:hypothetical protein
LCYVQCPNIQQYKKQILLRTLPRPVLCFICGSFLGIKFIYGLWMLPCSFFVLFLVPGVFALSLSIFISRFYILTHNSARGTRYRYRIILYMYNINICFCGLYFFLNELRSCMGRERAKGWFWVLVVSFEPPPLSVGRRRGAEGEEGRGWGGNYILNLYSDRLPANTCNYEGPTHPPPRRVAKRINFKLQILLHIPRRGWPPGWWSVAISVISGYTYMIMAICILYMHTRVRAVAIDCMYIWYQKIQAYVLCGNIWYLISAIHTCIYTLYTIHVSYTHRYPTWFAFAKRKKCSVL